MAIHHIEMDYLYAAGLDLSNLVGQARKITA
jgi:hypothetical protein